MKIKPMLAVNGDLDNLEFPLYVGVKYDGIRALVVDGVVLSRSLKPIPNLIVQERFGKPENNGKDGELVLGDIYAQDAFRVTTSAVMSVDKQEDVKFYVFDDFTNPELGYADRVANLTFDDENVIDGRATLVNSKEDLLQWLETERINGGEGLIGRYVLAPYKMGRSTLKQGSLLKFKFFEDSEFEVVGFEELFTNENPEFENELGRTARSSHKENLVAQDTLGSLVLKYEDRTFKCGTGFSMVVRKEIWENRDYYIGKLAKVRYMTVGAKDLPRIPSFKGFRDELDMS